MSRSCSCLVPPATPGGTWWKMPASRGSARRPYALTPPAQTTGERLHDAGADWPACLGRPMPFGRSSRVWPLPASSACWASPRRVRRESSRTGQLPTYAQVDTGYTQWVLDAVEAVAPEARVVYLSSLGADARCQRLPPGASPRREPPAGILAGLHHRPAQLHQRRGPRRRPPRRAGRERGVQRAGVCSALSAHGRCSSGWGPSRVRSSDRCSSRRPSRRPSVARSWTWWTCAACSPAAGRSRCA